MTIRESNSLAQTTVTERLLQALKARGAKAVFGIPGDYALPMFEIIEQSRILPLYTLSHEPAVAFAADASARVAGSIGVAAVTYGAGALNLVNGVAAAYAERSPVAVISAAPDSSRSWPALSHHHQVRAQDSQLKIYREITCAQAVLDDPSAAPNQIGQALNECRRLSLPVYFEIPSELARAKCAPVPFVEERKSDEAAVAECAAEIAGLVRSARSPVVMLGVEVRRFGLDAEVADLALRAGVPVVTSFMGRGVGSAYATGSYLGRAGDQKIATLVEESDGLILLGVILCDTNLGLPARKLDLRRIVHAFGGEVRVGHHIYRGVALRDLVLALFKHAPAADEHVPNINRVHLSQHSFVADNRNIEPSDIAVAINQMFMRHTVMPVTCDVGDSLFVSLELAFEDLLGQGYYASMGFAVPAALSVQATTNRRTLALVGDGAFQMTGFELGNCQRYGLDPIVVVLNNRGWGMLRLLSPKSNFNDLSDWHYADIARSLGGDGVRVRSRSELARALEMAWSRRGKFQLIEVMLDPGSTSKTLQRFAHARASQAALRELVTG